MKSLAGGNWTGSDLGAETEIATTATVRDPVLLDFNTAKQVCPWLQCFACFISETGCKERRIKKMEQKKADKFNFVSSSKSLLMLRQKLKSFCFYKKV